MSDERIWTAAVLVIGDEILSGRTQDKNVSQIATWLDVQGIRLREVRIVPDVAPEIVAALNALRSRTAYVFTTGGIDPTQPDTTVHAVGNAMGVDPVIHPETRAHPNIHYVARRMATSGARLRRAGGLPE